MRKLKAAFDANVPFKNNSVNLFYHTLIEFEVTLNANVSLKSLKLNKILTKDWKH